MSPLFVVAVGRLSTRDDAPAFAVASVPLPSSVASRYALSAGVGATLPPAAAADTGRGLGAALGAYACAMLLLTRAVLQGRTCALSQSRLLPYVLTCHSKMFPLVLAVPGTSIALVLTVHGATAGSLLVQAPAVLVSPAVDVALLNATGGGRLEAAPLALPLKIVLPVATGTVVPPGCAWLLAGGGVTSCKFLWGL